MPHSAQLESIRRLVKSVFAELGAEGDAELSESILIRDDNYCGRRFRTDGLHAIWFIEEEEVKVYARDGGLVRAMPATASAAEDVTQRRAA